MAFPFKYNYLTLFVIIALTTGKNSQANVSGVIDKGKGTYQINNGAVIIHSATSYVTGITAGKGDHYFVADNGSLFLALDSSAGNLKGVAASDQGVVDLGAGTQMVLQNTGAGAATGIYSDGYASVKGENMSITVHTVDEMGYATGINLASNGIVELSGNSKIIATNSTDGRYANGIFAFGQSGSSAKLSAKNLYIETSGTGINAQNNSAMTLDGLTVIKSVQGGIEAKGTSYSPDTGGEVSAEQVHITTTGAGTGTGGIFSLVSGKVTVGAGSVVQTENMHGLYATSNPGYPTEPQLTTIDYIGTETSRNLIQVKGQSGVTASGENTIIHLENTDIKTRSQNYKYGLRCRVPPEAYHWPQLQYARPSSALSGHPRTGVHLKFSDNNY